MSGLEVKAILLGSEARTLFPLQKIQDLEKLFQLEVIDKAEPDLALWSIILGAIENSLVHLDYSGVVNKPVGSYNSNGHGAVDNNGSSPTKEEEVKPRRLVVSPTNVTPGLPKRKSKGRGRISGLKNKVTADFKQAKRKSSDELEEGSGTPADDDVAEDEPNNNNKVSIEVDRPETKITGREECSGSDFPAIRWEDVEAVYLKFKALTTAAVEVTNCVDEEGAEKQLASQGSSKELVKKVSDVVWSYLSRSYKADNPHIQSLYTYILGKKLDSFGVAVAVTAGCQMLGLNDVHLALSEDHAWVYFGPDGQDTAEVTWHGKGIEDKRGLPVRLGEDENSWLYLKGNAVNCNRHMEIASLVAAINISINTTLNSKELLEIQRRLLWKLYEATHLHKYPMALSYLAEIEETRPTPHKKPCHELFQEAISSVRINYNDMHIFPYTMYAAYLSRQTDYKQAMKYWAHAARVVQRYGRTKNDEEIYREFLEISTDSLVNIMKSSSIGFSANSIIRDPFSFANLLEFFDGICMWEEHSKTPIVHITWAKAWVTAIGKFDYTIRRMVQISLGNSEEKENTEKNMCSGTKHAKDSDEEDRSFPKVTLYSQKMQQLKELVKKDKMSGPVTLLLTAQSSIGSDSHSKSTEEVSSVGTGRHRRERLTVTLDSPTSSKFVSNEMKSPPRKRAKLETGNPTV